jgi:oligopeptide/dipeptide ABC transporter ATP-binding protein
MTVLLDVKHLQTRFKSRKKYIYAVNDVSFQVHQGEALGVVGESGCGKSVTMLSLLNLLPPAARIERGQAIFNGNDLLKMNLKQISKVRGAKIGMIFQDPMSSLNPVVNIGIQLSEPLRAHLKMSKAEAWERSVQLLEMVGISEARARLNDYSHQLSGGMRQRVMIAMGLACKPKILIADEPTTALDVTIQAQIVDLVKDLREELQTTIIWITHDLSLIAGLVDRIMVMYAGYIVEEALVDDLYNDPRHPYTIGLFGSLPDRVGHQRRLTTIGGAPPNLEAIPTCCPFVPRCKYAIEKCKTENPSLQPVSGSSEALHSIACWVDIRDRREA